MVVEPSLPMCSQGKGDTLLYLVFQKQVPALGLQAADSLPSSPVGTMGLVREGEVRSKETVVGGVELCVCSFKIQH